MSEDPKRLLDAPDAADPDLPARLRADLRIARDASAGYDVDRGLARFSAAIGGGPDGGGHDGGGSAPGTSGNGAGHLASSGASGALGVKAGLAALVALGALGVALAVRPATQVPSSTAAAPSTTSEAAAITAPIASSPPRIEGPQSEVPRSPGPPVAASSASAGSRGAVSAAPSAGLTIRPEMEQYFEARRALASDPGRALALAEEGHARFPRGVFGQEREVIAIDALVKLGRAAEAKARARAFVARHPESPFAEGLRTLSKDD